MSGQVQKKNEETIMTTTPKWETNVAVNSQRLNNKNIVEKNDLTQKTQDTIETLQRLQNKNMVGKIYVEIKDNGETKVWAESTYKPKSGNWAVSAALNELESGASKADVGRFNELMKEGAISGKLPTGKEHYIVNGENLNKEKLGYAERIKNAGHNLFN